MLGRNRSPLHAGYTQRGHSTPPETIATHRQTEPDISQNISFRRMGRLSGYTVHHQLHNWHGGSQTNFDTDKLRRSFVKEKWPSYQAAGHGPKRASGKAAEPASKSSGNTLSLHNTWRGSNKCRVNHRKDPQSTNR